GTRGRTLAGPAPTARPCLAASVHAVEAETPAVALLLPVAGQREALRPDVEAEAHLWVRRRGVVAAGEDGEDPQAVPHADLEVLESIGARARLVLEVGLARSLRRRRGGRAECSGEWESRRARRH